MGQSVSKGSASWALLCTTSPTLGSRTRQEDLVRSAIGDASRALRSIGASRIASTLLGAEDSPPSISLSSQCRARASRRRIGGEEALPTMFGIN